MFSTVRISTLLLTLSLASQSMASTSEAEIRFNSSCDFKELKIAVKDEANINPGLIKLEVKLQPDATERLLQVSRKYLGKTLATYINNIKISTTTIRNELNTSNLTIAVDNKIAPKLFPGLLSKQCQPE
ncbi:hypothetical protein [Pseudomonas chlororaphis]|uniref:Uncharacterized protein n=1 Tax=Pseudomonas chlororaphis TaxID=587753 RepID=A0AAX3G567_9PSED|nr:hypothetical protein [Pseudomonas chlororaphis]AZC36769.1 Methionyl-tRNA formyltransferase [Pseudomonas chlororaphis subsp. piscium]AZC43315.1 Methionyl-tRNA formyltransferase [Pseudomonas chlororaphis subsp. piscium]AZC50006.1 Methionyl-tRNA formyltransferase [Pseudomonas chlororaphis subsp. piscium]AZC69039.1 Methionyl-tRNA formyltransferase [Pseudomonas chlororaphis subsp. piscium]WDG75190.1 hypothetical protein PUP65_12745 [Pseudomonas chlororaphis]